MGAIVGGMLGMNSETGRSVEGIAHLQQSVRDILTTPVGTRVMRREYGSRLPELVDAPLNEPGRMSFIYETVVALETWESRIKVEEVRLVQPSPGRVDVTISGVYLPDGDAITIEGIVVQ